MNSFIDFVTPRAVAVAELPFSLSQVFVQTATAIAAVVATPYAIVNPKKFGDFAEETEHFESIIPLVYTHFAKIVNPVFANDFGEIDECRGKVTDYVHQKIETLNTRIINRSSTSSQQALVRVTIAGGILLKTLARVADFALGVIAGVAALVTFGKISSLNKFAISSLSLLGVIHDWCSGIREVVRPSVLRKRAAIF